MSDERTPPPPPNDPPAPAPEGSDPRDPGQLPPPPPPSAGMAAAKNPKDWQKFFESPVDPYPPLSNPSERQWAVGMHASAFAGIVIPFGNVIAPLIIWTIKRPESPYLDAVGKEVVNFHISFIIYFIVSAVLAMLLACLVVPIILPFAVGILALVYMILAIIKTSDGVDYRYPLTFRFIK